MVAGGGCAQVLDFDHEYVSSDDAEGAGGGGGGSGVSSSSASSSSSGFPGECPDGFECAPLSEFGGFLRMAINGLCPTGWEVMGEGYDGNDPGCSPCSCGAPSMGTCNPRDVIQWGDNICDSADLDVFSPANGACVDLLTHASGYEIETAEIQGGNCAPSSSQPLPLNKTLYCAYDASKATPCGQGGACVPSAPELKGSACSPTLEGGSCDPGLVDEGLVYFISNDTRSCSCSCAKGGSCPDVSVTLYGTNDCSGVALKTLDSSTKCTDTVAVPMESSFKLTLGSWVSGPCMASTNPSGQVLSEGAFRMCCLP